MRLILSLFFNTLTVSFASQTSSDVDHLEDDRSDEQKVSEMMNDPRLSAAFLPQNLWELTADQRLPDYDFPDDNKLEVALPQVEGDFFQWCKQMVDRMHFASKLLKRSGLSSDKARKIASSALQPFRNMQIRQIETTIDSLVTGSPGEDNSLEWVIEAEVTFDELIKAARIDLPQDALQELITLYAQLFGCLLWTQGSMQLLQRIQMVLLMVKAIEDKNGPIGYDRTTPSDFKKTLILRGLETPKHSVDIDETVDIESEPVKADEDIPEAAELVPERHSDENQLVTQPFFLEVEQSKLIALGAIIGIVAVAAALLFR